MCNPACIKFVNDNIQASEIRGKKILEVGSYDVNGTVRPILERYQPAQYIGVDITKGPGVDEICDAKHLLSRFGKESFDVLITTEFLEHFMEWRTVISLSLIHI